VGVDLSCPSSYSPSTCDFEQNTKILADVCSEYVTRQDTGWRNVVVEHPDPQSLVAAADEHGVLPLLARMLSEAGIACEVAQARARQIAFHNLALAAELVKVIGALQELRIQALAYKGPMLGHQLYGEVPLRQFRDLDILVAPEDVPRTRDALCQLGYQEIEPFRRTQLRKHVSSQCEWPMRGTQSGTVIELHWALFPRYASFDLSVTELENDSVTIEIAGKPVRAIGCHHLALVLSAHGAKHSWYRLGWLVDFALVLSCRGDGEAEKLLEDAARKGLRRILLIAAALAEKVVRLKLPGVLESALSNDPGVAVLADQMQQALCTGVISEDLLSENILLLRSRERWSDRMRIVARLAFTPGPPEWSYVGLPEWADWMYRPIRFARAARYFPRIVRRAFS
jgi:hypothetical protein